MTNISQYDSLQMQDLKTELLEAAFYGRYSDDKSRPSSIEDQLRECRQEAARKGCSIPDHLVFGDEDVKGFLERRPQLDRLKNLITSETATFSELFIADTSRLSRNSALATRLRQYFDNHGIRLHFVENGMTSGTQGFDLQYHFQSFFDEQYSKQLGQKVHRGQLGLILKGRTPSGSCYGYRNVAEEHPSSIGMYGKPVVIGVNKVIVPEQASVIREIFRLYLAGHGYATVATMLNERGVLSPRPAYKYKQRGWAHATVRHILHNERYRGITIFNRKRNVRDPETEKMRQKDRPMSEWVTFTDLSLQIVPDDTWEAAVARRKVVSGTYKGPQAGGLARSQASRGFLFSGLLRCGLCGASLVMNNGTNKNGTNKYGAYYCSNARRSLGCTNKGKVRRISLETILIERMTMTIQSGAHFDSVKSQFLAELKVEMARRERASGGEADEKRALSRQIKDLRDGLEKLGEEVANHGGSETIRNLISRKEAGLVVVEKQLAAASTVVRQPSNEEVDGFLSSAFTNLSSILTGDPIQAKMELHKRISTLTLTPVIHDGDRAFAITGDLQLFSADQLVLLSSSVVKTTQQHYSSLGLNGLILKLDSKDDVIACLRPATITEDTREAESLAA